MSDIQEFSQKIQERMRLNQEELSRRQLEVNEQMTQILEKQETFSRSARNIVARVIYPRLQELSRTFENAKLLELDPERDLHALCEFSHSTRYPAKVTLDIALLPVEDYSFVTIRYGLNIFPSLIEYQRAEEKTFPLDAEDDIGDWVEEKLFGFIETYLQLQGHPLYQKDNLVIDPVCNMRFPVDEAAGKIDLHGQTFFSARKLAGILFAKAEICSVETFSAEGGEPGRQGIQTTTEKEATNEQNPQNHSITDPVVRRCGTPRCPCSG